MDTCLAAGASLVCSAEVHAGGGRSIEGFSYYCARESTTIFPVGVVASRQSTSLIRDGRGICIRITGSVLYAFRRNCGPELDRERNAGAERVPYLRKLSARITTSEQRLLKEGMDCSRPALR